MEAALLAKLAQAGSGDFASDARLVNCSGTAMSSPQPSKVLCHICCSATQPCIVLMTACWVRELSVLQAPRRLQEMCAAISRLV